MQKGTLVVNGISYSGGGGQPAGTTNYTDLENKPKINDVTLVGNVKLADLGINLSQYMTKVNPEGTGSLSLNRRAESEVGTNSVTIGVGNEATGAFSFASGAGTSASGSNSHTEGAATFAINMASHAEGTSTTASGQASHAEGSNTEAFGPNSHVEGSGSKANGSGSHAEGSMATAMAQYSHAEGNSTLASGDYSHSHGYYTIAAGKASTAIGSCNVEDEEKIFIIGNGNDSEGSIVRSDALNIDYNGNTWIAGTVSALNEDGERVILGSGGSGTTVEVETMLEEGISIAKITVDGEEKIIKAPDTIDGYMEFKGMVGDETQPDLPGLDTIADGATYLVAKDGDYHSGSSISSYIYLDKVILNEDYPIDDNGLLKIQNWSTTYVTEPNAYIMIIKYSDNKYSVLTVSSSQRAALVPYYKGNRASLNRASNTFVTVDGVTYYYYTYTGFINDSDFVSGYHKTIFNSFDEAKNQFAEDIQKGSTVLPLKKNDLVIAKDSKWYIKSSGEGSVITVTPAFTEGTKIATIIIGDEEIDLYIPINEILDEQATLAFLEEELEEDIKG